uniref:CSON003500 protein n=1 Tax=Culicoides sonorensis TaxID=179676 RepID=A0A336LWL4_CULSO
MSQSSPDSSDIVVKFPEVTTSNDNQTSHDYVPVVIILGWAGCQDKYLQKYSKIYEDKAFITIRCCTAVKNVFWDKAGMCDIAQRIVKLIRDMKLEEHPIFLHAFSNGGAFLYEHVSLLLRQGERPITLKGVIFDSAPGERRVKNLFLVMQEIFGRTPVIGPIIASLIFGILLFLYTLQMFYYNVKEKLCGHTPGSDPYRALLIEDTKYPILIFYSKKDHLISYDDVEYYANYRENLGINVTKMCFDDTAHVKHYLKHPEVYVNSIQKFMSDCLN